MSVNQSLDEFRGLLADCVLGRQVVVVVVIDHESGGSGPIINGTRGHIGILAVQGGGGPTMVDLMKLSTELHIDRFTLTPCCALMEGKFKDNKVLLGIPYTSDEEARELAEKIVCEAEKIVYDQLRDDQKIYELKRIIERLTGHKGDVR